MLNLQLRTEKNFNFFHADIEAGRLPVRLTAFEMPKDSMSTKAPIAFEMVPTRLELNSELWRTGGGTGAERGGGGSAHVCRQARRQLGSRQRRWVSTHMDVMELSQLSDCEQSELALFGPHSTRVRSHMGPTSSSSGPCPPSSVRPHRPRTFPTRRTVPP